MNNHDNEKKVTICGCHFAYVYHEMWDKLGKKVGLRKRTDWLIEKCKDQFNLKLETKEDIGKLEIILNEHYYKDKADWLREKIRDELKRDIK